MPQPDNIKLLYDNLVSDGYTDLGTEDDFRTALKDNNNVESLYNNLKEDGYEDLGNNVDEFRSTLGFVTPSTSQGDMMRYQATHQVTPAPVQNTTTPTQPVTAPQNTVQPTQTALSQGFPVMGQQAPSNQPVSPVQTTQEPVANGTNTPSELPESTAQSVKEKINGRTPVIEVENLEITSAPDLENNQTENVPVNNVNYDFDNGVYKKYGGFEKTMEGDAVRFKKYMDDIKDGTINPGDDSPTKRLKQDALKYFNGDEEEAEEYMWNVVLPIADGRAEALARGIIRSLGEHPTQERLRELYYNEGWQADLWNAAREMGIDAESFNNYVKGKIQAHIKDDANLRSSKLSTSELYDNPEHIRDEQERRALVEDLGGVIDPYIDPAIKAEEERANKEKFGNYRFDPLSMFLGWNQLNYLIGDYKNPQNVINEVEKSVLGNNGSGLVSALLGNQEVLGKIEQRAANMDMDVNDYIDQYVAPTFMDALLNRVHKALVAKEVPQSDIDYIMRGLTEDNMFASAFHAMTRNAAQQEIVNQGDAQYDAGLLASGLRTTGSFAVEFPIFMATGSFGSTGGRFVVNSIVRNLVSKGMSESAARVVVGDLMKSGAWKSYGMKLLQHIPSSSLNLGSYEAATSAVNSWNNHVSLGEAIENTVGGFAHGAYLGAVLGVGGALTDTWMSKANSALWKRWGAAGLGYGIETGSFYTANELEKLVNGEDAFVNPLKGIINQGIELAFIKFAPGHTWKSIYKNLRHPVKSMREAREQNKPYFTQDDIDQLSKYTSGKDLKESLLSMNPADENARVTQNIRIAAEKYDAFMADKEVPQELKVKVARMFGKVAPIAGRPVRVRPGSEAVNNKVVKTYDENGQLITEKTYPTHEEAVKAIGDTQDQLVLDRPRTESVMVTADNVLELDKDGRVIDEYPYSNDDDLQEIEQRIQLNRDNRDLYDAARSLDAQLVIEANKDVYGEQVAEDQHTEEKDKLVLEKIEELKKSGRGSEAVIRDFAERHDMTEKQVTEIMEKPARKRTQSENELMNYLKEEMQNIGSPDDKLNSNVSEQKGRELAGTTPVVNEEDAAGLQQEVTDAKSELDAFLNENPKLKTDVENMLAQGTPMDEVMMYVATQVPEARQDEALTLLARYGNAQTKQERYLQQIGENIDNYVEAELGRLKFKGTIDGEPEENNLVTIIDGDGKEYTVINGNIRLLADGTIDPNGSEGIIIARDKDGNIVSFKPDDRISINELIPSDKYANDLRNALGEAATESLVKTGVVTPPTEEAPVERVEDKVEEKPTEQVEETPVEQIEEVKEETPTEETPTETTTEEKKGQQTIPVAKNGRTKQYHKVDVDTAIDDILSQPESKYVKGNNDPAAVADRRIKSLNERRNQLDKKLEKRYRDQDFTEEEAADITAWEQGGEEPKTEMGKFIAEMAEINSQIEYYDNLKKEWQKRKAKKVISGEPVDETVDEDFANVPEWRNDTPEDARRRGYKKIEGHKVSRQEEKPMPKGKEVEVQYSTKDSVKGRMTVSELDEVQGSHLTNGQRNDKHFIPEGQPKAEFGADRQQKAQTNATEEKFRPELMTSFADTQSAYQSSATQTNRRGEVIQGNGRRNLAEYIYAPGNEKVAEMYRKYLMEHAEELGTTAEEIEKMKKPFAHIVLDVDDAEAIRLGQFKASDLESGGKEIPEVSTVTTKLGDKYSNFTNIVLRHDDPDASLSERIESNAEEAVTWLNKAGVISDTEAKTLLSDKTAARQFVKDMLTDTLFRGANENVRSSFYELPKNIQSAIVSVVGREVATTDYTSILKEVQASIQAYHELMASSDQFAGVKGRNFEERYRQADAAVEDWLRQINIDGSLNTEKYSNFALELAKRYKSHTDQKSLAGLLRDYYDLVNGSTREVNMFDAAPTSEKLTREEAIKKVFDIDYKPLEKKENGRQRTVSVAGDHQESEAGRRGVPGNPESSEREESRAGSADNRGGDSVDAGEVKPSDEPITTSDPTEAINQAAESFRGKQGKADKLYEAYENEQGTVETEGGLVKNEVSERSMSPHWRGALHALGRRIGKRVVVLSEEDIRRRGYDPENTNGFTIGDTIFMNERYARESEDLRSFIAGHEVTHTIKKESPEIWDAYVEAVKESMGEDFDKAFNETKERYDNFYDEYNKQNPDKPLTKLTDEQITEEICCDWAGHHVLTDEDAIRRIVEKAEQAGADSVSLTRRILDWINESIRSLKSALGRGEDVQDDLDAMERAKKLWQGMYDVAAAKQNEKKKPNANEEVQHSVRADEIKEKYVKNVVANSNEIKLPRNRQEAIDAVSKMERPFVNGDQNKEIKLYNNGIRHIATQDHEHTFTDVRCLGIIDKIISNAVKIGEIDPKPGRENEIETVEVYYCPVNIDGKQYSARLIVNQYKNRGRILDDYQLYDLNARHKKTDVSSSATGHNALTSLSASDSGYKVKDLIHYTQENDQKLLGISDKNSLKFSLAPNTDSKLKSGDSNYESDKINEKREEIFVSNARRAVEGIKQEKATPEQWLAMIQKNGGLKAGEDKWIGLSDWLKEQDKKSLTKQEVLDYIRENQIQVEDANYKENIDVDDNSQMQKLRGEFNELVSKYENEKNAVEDEANAFNDEMFEKYGQGWANDPDRLSEEDQRRNDEMIERWQKLNDEDIRELAFREMVEKYGDDFEMAFEVNYGNGELEPQMDMYGDDISEAAKYFLALEDNPINSTRLQYTTEGLDNKREIALVVPTIEPYNESDTIHFGDAGNGRAVAWVRFGETTDNDGKRVLVIDEIQSKRHQDGREKGYREDLVPGTDLYNEYHALKDDLTKKDDSYDEYLKELRKKYKATDLTKVTTEEEKKTSHDMFVELEDARYKLNHFERLNHLGNFATESVPEAPFEKNWHELAMKRMLRYAAENGYDKIAWTTGDQQADRYGIGSVVDALRIDPYKAQSPTESDGHDLSVHLSNGTTYEMFVQPDGTLNSDSDMFDGKKVSEVFGKELGNKIMTADKVTRLDNEDLRIGAEGMQGFYDQILPRFMDKYGKKWNVKTGEVELPEVEESACKMHSIDVTPEMKESVMEGQPMFSIAKNNKKPSEEKTKEIFDAAKKTFGPTNDIREAGYVLPDGTMLDFSGRHLLNKGDDSSFLKGRRTSDHRGIGSVGWEYDADGNEIRTGIKTDMPDFIERGAIRIDNNAGTINLIVKPTGKQRDVLARLIRNNGGDVTIDFGNGWDTDHSVDYYEAKYPRVLNDIDRYFDEGIKPEGNQPQFSLNNPEPQFSLRKKEDPKKTQKVYKLMRLGDDGKLYPLFIDSSAPTELGKWYDADSPDLSILQKMPAGTFLVDYKNGTYTSMEDYAKEHGMKMGKYPSKEAINDATANGLRWVRIEDTDRGQRRYGGENRKYMNLGINGSGTVGEFAMRPGWHAGSLPSMRQIGKGKDRNLRDDRFVWVEGEVPADKDYQAEANANPDKDIPTHIPEDGYYMKATNANREASQADRIGWYVAGAFKANRIMSDSEARKVIDDWNREHPDQKVEYDFERESGKEFNADTMQLEDKGKTDSHKEAQFEVIQKGNPAQDDLHTWIRSVDDIKTYDEALKDSGYEDGEGMTPDYTDEMVKEALETGKVTVYSSKPIKDGIFVTPSKMEAKSYAGDGKVYSKEVSLDDVAWIDGLQGQYAKVEQPKFSVRKSRIDEEDPMRAIDTAADEWRKERKEKEVPKKVEEPKLSVSESVEPTGNKYIDSLIRLATRNSDDQKHRVQAMRAIGGNLAKLRSAMSLQRKYDQGTVKQLVDLAQGLMNDLNMDELTRGEVKRLTNLVAKGAGKESIMESAKKVYDMMVDHELKHLDKLLRKQLQVSVPKLNSSGVPVQGRMDADGVRMMRALKNGMALDERQLDEKIGSCYDRMGSDDKVESDNAKAELQGYELAKQYLDDVKKSEADEALLRQELREESEKYYDYERVPMTDAEGNVLLRKDGEPMTREVRHLKPEYRNNRSALKALREFETEVENAIRENQTKRMEKYLGLLSNVGSGAKASMERAKEWREKQVERVKEIQHNANSDLQGIPADEHSKQTWKQHIVNWAPIRFFMRPMATFDQMLRFIGRKSPNGEGYLFNRFMNGYTEASDKEWKGWRAANEELDNKVSEVFGKKMRWGDLFSIERKMDGMDVDFYDGGEKKTHHLTQGNMLYIYMVNKMTDGRMKLRKMGITEEDVENIKEHLDPRFVELADWLQSKFLTKMRSKYNKVHERMFGTSMDAIENYFPLVINKRSRAVEEDVSSPDYEEKKPATITGSIIKRKVNATPLDITGADAFDVVLGHLRDMEHWAAYAEMNRDINALLNYKRFRNRMMNMSSLQYGSGQQLWKNFVDTAQIVSGVYTPKVSRDSVDTTLVNMAKGVTSAKISLRLYTAMKQLLSYPAYLSEANPIELIKSSNPVGAAKAWNWAVEELPGFSKRWQSRIAGDTRLQESDVDWELWRNNIVRTAAKFGMTPNAFVDAMTVAMGAKAIYETKYKRFINDGYSEEQAKKKALNAASIAFNETQQSSEGAYTSAMQLDRTATSVALSVFRNASMGYTRRMNGALRNLKHLMTPGYKEQTLEFMKKQMVRDGLTEEQAESAAKRAYNRALYRSIADTMIFGWVMQAAWNLGPYVPYLLLGNDDDKKEEMLMDAAIHAFIGGAEGLTGGNVISDLYNKSRTGQDISNYEFNLLPLMSDIRTTLKHFKSNDVAAWNDIVNILVQSGIGVNPQTISDAFVAIMDATDGNPKTSREAALLLMRVLQVPQSAIDQLYIDELGMSARGAQNIGFDELASRYAEYKRHKGAPLTGWMYSDEEKNKVDNTYIKRFTNLVTERAEVMDQDDLLRAYDNTENLQMKKILGKEEAKRIGEENGMEGVEDTYGQGAKKEWQKLYVEIRTVSDLGEDVLLQMSEKDAQNNGNIDLANEIKNARESISKLKQNFKTRPRAEVMREIRDKRTRALKKYRPDYASHMPKQEE